jgi:hypothetical protein
LRDSGELHDQAFGCAAGFEEFAEGYLDDVEAARFQLGAEFPADLVEDDGAAYVDGVAGEAECVFHGYDDSLFGWVEGFDLFDGSLVESFGEIHHIAAFERSEAGVEVVEARVDEVEWGDLDVPRIAEGLVAGDEAAGAIACPEAGTVGAEESVAFAFERGGAGDVEDGVASFVEPGAEVRLFILTLGVEETADDDGAVAFETGVGGEDHVGRTGLGLDEFDFGDAADGFVEALPLLGGAGLRGGVDVALHPGVDDVVHVVELGGAHQEGGRADSCKNFWGRYL